MTKGTLRYALAVAGCFAIFGIAQAAPSPTGAAAGNGATKITAQQAFRDTLAWASGRTQPEYLDQLYASIERSAYRYGIQPEFALAVVAAEAKYGHGISYARQDSWHLYEVATQRKLKGYPAVFDDVDTALSELSQIIAGSRNADAVFRTYWCGAKGQMNTDSYANFHQAAGTLWNALEPYERERLQRQNPHQASDASQSGQGYNSNWGRLAYGDMEGYQSKLRAMPRLASQLKCFPKQEGMYAQVAKYYNRNLSDAEATVIARCVLTFSEQTQGVVDPRLVMAVVKAESNFRPTAVSRCGALGLGQLMPATARGLGIRDPMDPIQNIFGCVKYLEREMYRWRSSSNGLDLVIASYNAGAGAVQRFGGVPPYSETRSYVKIVKQHYNTYTARR